MPLYPPPTESQVCGTGATPNKGTMREVMRAFILSFRSLLGTTGDPADARTALEVYGTAETYTQAEVDAAIAAIPVPSTQSFRNPVINGDFAVDQEFAGAAVTVTAGAALKYVIDGWYAWCTGANVTFQTITTAGRKRARFTGAASNTLVGFATRMEAANTAHFASAFATISALLSSSSITTVNWGLYYASSTDSFGTVASPTRTTIDTGTFTITSTEAAYSAITAAALASGATTGLELVFTIGALLGSQTFTIGDAQVESGSVAAPAFEIVPITEMLIRCQRLYYKYKGNLRAYATVSSGPQREANFMFPVEMRASPTVTYGSWAGGWSTGPTTTITTQSFSATGDVASDANGQVIYSNGFVANARL